MEKIFKVLKKFIASILVHTSIKSAKAADYSSKAVAMHKIVDRRLEMRRLKFQSKQNTLSLKGKTLPKCNLKMVNKADYPGWVSGFTDGEGCFSVSFTKREKLNLGVEVRPSFSIGQKAHSRESLEKLQNYFDCGAIRYSKKDGLYKYEVRSLDDLFNKLIPFFEKYPLETAKKQDFEKFAKVCRAMKQGHHLNSTGIKEIIDTSYEMNVSGKRGTPKEELISEVDKKTKKS